jgi:hypothetical protein
LPYSLAPTLKWPNGKVVRQISNVRCPYLDDYEPNERSIAAPALVQSRTNATQQSADFLTCEGKDNTNEGWSEPWTAVITTRPTRVSLHPQGCENILELLWRVEMVKSARRAVTGNGVCVGLTYKDQAFVHPKTKKCR